MEGCLVWLARKCSFRVFEIFEQECRGFLAVSDATRKFLDMTMGEKEIIKTHKFSIKAQNPGVPSYLFSGLSQTVSISEYMRSSKGQWTYFS